VLAAGLIFAFAFRGRFGLIVHGIGGGFRLHAMRAAFGEFVVKVAMIWRGFHGHYSLQNEKTILKQISRIGRR
jgi:hypothetical protein